MSSSEIVPTPWQRTGELLHIIHQRRGVDHLQQWQEAVEEFLRIVREEALRREGEPETNEGSAGF